MKTSVVIVDDDALLASSLAYGLKDLGVNVTGTFPSAADVVSHSVDKGVNVALLDFDLGPGPTGIDLARALREKLPSIGLILLTTYSDPRLKIGGLPSLPKGAAYITKSAISDLNEVTRVIDRVSRNPMTGDGIRNDSDSTPLTTTQIEILRSVSNGLSTTQIAAERGVSTKAVEQQLTKIYDALDLPRGPDTNQRVHLVRDYLKRSGLVE